MPASRAGRAATAALPYRACLRPSAKALDFTKMKMGRTEKLFVNSAIHSQWVARHAEKLLLRTRFERGQRYLDLGCGNGEAPLYLARRHGLAVTGIDVDRDQIRAAEQAAGGVVDTRFLTLDGTKLPFEDGEFDLVATSKATHHITEWETALEELVRVLRPGGYFLYFDLVYPRWIAAAGRRFLSARGGYPTARALDAFVERQGLDRLYRLASIVSYTSICRRPARSTPIQSGTQLAATV